MKSLAALGEFPFIEAIRRIVAASAARRGDKRRDVVLGIGDDAACVRLRRAAVVTVDCVVEGVHFRRDWLRPADLVGAIANEAGVSAREIGAIEIEERFSLVEISDTIAEDVVRALRGTSLRGQRVTVRKDQPKRSTK